MKTLIGAYGPWAASLVSPEPGPLSLQNCSAPEFESRRVAARARVLACMAPPPDPGPVQPTVQRRWEYDGLEIEELSWPQPAGAPTAAWVLKPLGAKGRLPGLLALHDHGGFKFYGKEKIAQVGPAVHPLVREHWSYYGGVPWANEIARRGFVVLVHDAYAFGSRRVRLRDVPEVLREGLRDDTDESPETIIAYNNWTGTHEHVMAKSLFCAGTTWPGVFFTEDRMALDVLCARPDVDPERVGIGGLSGGGLRTVFLGGLDERVKCAVCVGLMTTWRDCLLNKSYTHTWMCFVPHLPRELDFPEIFGLRAPRATLVMNTHDDGLFTHAEMERAEGMLTRVFASAGAAERFKCAWHPGGHQFNRPMQSEAFAWFERWLG